MALEGRTGIDALTADVAGASAAYLLGVLPEILSAPPAVAFGRLADHFETAIRAYCEGLENWGASPTDCELADEALRPE